jgi:hypothetical protein
VKEKLNYLPFLDQNKTEKFYDSPNYFYRFTSPLPVPKQTSIEEKLDGMILCVYI